MKIFIVFTLVLLACAASLGGQLIFPLLSPKCQSNINVTATPEHVKQCPEKYTNLLSNTNLFTPEDLVLLQTVSQKYCDVTVSNGPLGTVLEKIESRHWSLNGKTIKTFEVSCFVDTNSGNREEIAFEGTRQILVNRRDPSGDGYNLNLIYGRLGQFQGVKRGVLDGLYVEQLFDSEHCNYWARFKQGKIVGKFLGWNQAGQINMEAEFKEPFDFVSNSRGKFDLSWVAAKSNFIEK